MNIVKNPFGGVVKLYVSRPFGVGTKTLSFDLEFGKFYRGLSRTYRRGFSLDVNLLFVFINISAMGTVITD